MRSLTRARSSTPSCDFEIDLIRFIREKSGGPKHERLREMSDADGVSNIGISLK